MVERYISISANELLQDSYRLARKVLDSGFKPDFTVALWRGGTPVGSAVQELFKYKGVETDHIAIRTSRYIGIDETETVRVHGLDYIVEHANADDSLLLVDDVYDSGLSIQAVLKSLEEKMRRNMPQTIKVATVYFKPGRNQTDMVPNFYVHKTEEWLMFPHELYGYTIEQIEESKGKEIADILR